MTQTRPIGGFGNKYLATDEGKIINARTGKPISQCSHPRGYLSCFLIDGGIRKRKLSHQVVAAAFLGTIPAGMQVNHINGVKTDNRPSNLEYVTPSGNVRHAQRTGLRSSVSSLTEAQVAEIRHLRSRGHRVKDLAAQFGVVKSHISKICHGTRRPVD